MSGWFELITPAGRLRRTHQSQTVIDGLEAVAELDLGPPFLTGDGTPTRWTLDGVPVPEERARAIIGGIIGARTPPTARRRQAVAMGDERRPPGMRVNRHDQERRAAVSQTRARISDAIGAGIAAHQLSYAEILLALAEESATWAGLQTRAEREQASQPQQQDGPVAGLLDDLRLLLDAADPDYFSTENLPALEEAVGRLWAAVGGAGG